MIDKQSKESLTSVTPSPTPAQSTTASSDCSSEQTSGINLDSNHYSLDGNRLINLRRLKSFIDEISDHVLQCNGSVTLLGEKQHNGLASTLESCCTMCNHKIVFMTSTKITIGDSKICSMNAAAVLGQISTGGGAAQLEEQMSAIDSPSMRSQTFVNIERSFGDVFEKVVTAELLAAGEEEKRLAIENGQYHQGIPAISVVVDAGWSKRSHKHTYNANSGVGVIFGNATGQLLYVGVRNKYCSVCSIAERGGREVPNHRCFKNWSGSSTSMEADIIVQGFNMSESMHGLRYIKLIGDGDSSVHHSIISSVPYGRFVEKVECANHAVKCYHSRLANIVKDNSEFGGHGKLTKGIIKNITQAARKAITAHSQTGDVEALRHDLRNGPRHYFGDHSGCNASYCKKKDETSTGKYNTCNSHYYSHSHNTNKMN